MKRRAPHPFVLLLAGVAVAAILTWIIPAGKYERHNDASVGHEVLVPGTYAPVPPHPVGPMTALMAVPQGIVAAADVIVVILFVGGAFTLLESTGALRRLAASITSRSRHPRVVLALVSLLFATLGALDNMFEEMIALVPVILLLGRGLGFGSISALAMSIGSAVVGAAFGPTNPFQAGIALRLAGLQPLDDAALRCSMLAVAIAVWIAWTLLMAPRDKVAVQTTETPSDPASTRDLWLLLCALAPFGPYVFGILHYDWGFNELSALFLAAGFGIGALSGLNLTDTTTTFLNGMSNLLSTGLLVGAARGISIVLSDGQILDTLLYAFAIPLSHFSGAVAAAMMIPVHGILHIAVPSLSGQAVLTIPIMAPLSDLLQTPRATAVIAYQTGAGLVEMLNPTNGALLAVLLAARVGYGRWLRFALPGALCVSLVGLAGILLVT